MAAHLDGFLKRRATVLAALVATMFAAPLAASVQCVTTLNDSGPGSLRQCIIDANAANNDQTIGFSGALDGGTITLTSGSLPTITAGMTIAGPGANLLTISGGNIYQVFNVDGETLAISGLTIANGKNATGGAIVNNGGVLVVSNCTFSNNAADNGGAINNGGAMQVNNSTFFGNTATVNGGAINNGGALTVNNSTFFNNSASTDGGAIFDSVDVTIDNSTLSGNTAGDGGGIFRLEGAVTLNNNIVAGNTETSVSGLDCFGCGTPSNNLIGGNPQLSPPGWYGGSTQTMLPLPGSLAIGAGLATTTDNPNTDQRGFFRQSMTGSTIDLGAVQTNYLIVITTADTLDSSPGCNSTGTGTPCSLRDALTLAPSGGADIAFASGVIGAINLSNALGALPQIGGNLNLVGPGANVLTVSGGGSSAVGSIFNVTSSNAALSGITLADGNSGSHGGGILSQGTLTVNNNAFSGNTAADAGGGIFSESGTLMVTNSTFSGNTALNGGGISNDLSTLIVTNSTFSGNATDVGGAIYLNNGTLAVGNSTIFGNTKSAAGGGIYNGLGTLTVNNSILAGDAGGECGGSGCPSNGSNGNVVIATPSQPILAPLGYYGGPTQTLLPLPGSAPICAGSVSLIPGGVTTDQRGFARLNLSSPCVDAGAVQTNYLIVSTALDTLHTTPPAACDASGDGPCTLRDALTLAATNGSADIAFASGVAGTIDTLGPLPPITGNLDLFGPGANIQTISGGNSPTPGGLFTVNSLNAAISGITIANGNDTGTGEGGGIFNSGILTVSNSAFSDNTSATFGGAIFNDQGTLWVIDSTFSGGNNAMDGGAIYNANGGTMMVSNSSFSGNGAVDGGAIFNNAKLTVSNSTVSGNSAGPGGGILNVSSLTLTNSIVAGNMDDGQLGLDDCDGCGTQSAYNLIGGVPQLKSLGSFGGPTQTMLPLPGSPAICAGSPSLDPAGLLYDQRGFPRLNTTYEGYTPPATPCLDLGAVQTNYSVQFAQSAYTGVAGVAVSSPAYPVVTVTENTLNNVGGVPVTLSFFGTAPTTVSGTGPVNTVAGTGATFSYLQVSPANDYTLEASLAITSSVTISNTASLDIDTPATVTGVSVTSNSPSGTYTTNAMISITVTFNKPITVTGIPTLALNSGATVNYSSGSGSRSLVFIYTVGTGQSANPLDANTLSGTIQDSSNVAANLTLPAPGGAGSISASETIVINTTQYTLTIVASPSAGGKVAANPAFTPNVTPPLSNGIYLAGTNVTLTATAKSTYIFSSWTGTTNSNSNPLMITMNGPVSETANFVLPTTTVGSVSESPSVYGDPVELIAQVSNGTSKPPNGGTVTFKMGSTIVGSGPVSNGVASYSMNGLQVSAGGNPTIAYYSGDSTDEPSQSASFEFLVIAENTTTTVTYSPIPAVHNKNLTLTATVAPQYSGTPTGTVTFTENGGTPVTVTLVNGTATYSFIPSQAGTFTITAVYNPPVNGNFNLSSGSVKLTIE